MRYNAPVMKNAAIVHLGVALVIVSLLACRQIIPPSDNGQERGGTEAASRQQAQPTITASNLERETCAKHQLAPDQCGEYRVFSYDATWRNELGNQGLFMLERDGLTISAHCGGESCPTWADSVGKTVIADKSISDLIIHYNPLCESPTYVKTALEFYERNKGKPAAVAEVCWDTLLVERIQAKAPK
jgi:hypothetical protein